jgi:short-subunit dehydrogenase involved in D-alanine esterification of teichoic acids
MKLTGKKALITGGESGIGLASARLFIEFCLKLWLVGQHQTHVEEVHGYADCSQF